MKVLGIAPCFDEATTYSFEWYERLRDSVRDKVELTELLRSQATRAAFESNVETFNPDVVIFYNHGDRQGLVAQDAKGYVIDKKNDHLLKDRVTYSMACLWGSDGAIDAYNKGAKVVVAYVEAFAFTPYDEGLFSNAANSGFIAYVNGETNWNRIKQLMVKTFDEMIEKTKDAWSKVWLRWDRDALRIYAEGVDEPEEKCPVARFVKRVFGIRFLNSLRKLRGRILFAFSSCCTSL